MRIALGVEYDGFPYRGWQSQSGLLTVQNTLEIALSRIAAEPIKIFCAGRTDAGVHGVGQVVHFDTLAMRNLSAWVIGVNTLLPATIAVQWAAVVPETFHARFSALSRAYRYVIYQSPARSAIWAHKALWYRLPLDLGRMQEGAKHFLGEQDFSSFRSSRCEAKTAIREIITLSIVQASPFIYIDICANAFLHHMVRNIVGILLRLGTYQLLPSDVPAIIAARDRRVAFETAPPDGLYLQSVSYPQGYLPQKKGCANGQIAL